MQMSKVVEGGQSMRDSMQETHTSSVAKATAPDAGKTTNGSGNAAATAHLASDSAAQAIDKDNDQMKERFAKLLLGEDMSGGGKGVSSALALSNAITNTAAAVFGEQRKLEPMQPEQRLKWKREIDSLLSVTDYIVEFSPSQQMGKDGTMMEIMTTKQRTDLQMNIPALKKLDIMLINCLDNFKDQKEFYYVKKSADDSEKSEDTKWWLPTVKVPPEGLSEDMRKWIQSQKDAVNQVLKASQAINAQVISEMEIPETYIDSLPKNGRSSLGDALYKSITTEYFDPEQFLSSMDLSSEHKIVDLKDKIEASIVIWKRKMTTNKETTKTAWGGGVKLEKREAFEDRAETILLIIKHRFPGISQSSLDIYKIQYNRDVGHAILESYSRILESLAHKVLSQIEDVISADAETLNPRDLDLIYKPIPFNAGDAAGRTLLDFMTWPPDDGDDEVENTPMSPDDAARPDDSARPEDAAPPDDAAQPNDAANPDDAGQDPSAGETNRGKLIELPKKYYMRF